MTDTDSLMLKVKKIKDIWADIKTFNREHENWIEDEGNPRNGQLGVFKSETGKDPHHVLCKAKSQDVLLCDRE